MKQKSTNKNTVDLHVNASEEVLKGVYTNAFRVTATDETIVIDTAYIYPTESNKKSVQEAQMLSRVIMPHGSALRLAQRITEILTKRK